MAESAQDIEAAGASIIWVLERSATNAPGTAERCVDFMTNEAIGADRGWCVGDGQTEPDPREFDNSPFSEGRGFDIVVPTGSMVIEANANHGTPSGNDNLDGAEILALVEQVISAAE